MNRRDFIVAAAVIATAPVPALTKPAHSPTMLTRRVDIFRDDQILENRPFSDIIKGDVIQVISTFEDACNGRRYNVCDHPGVPEEPYTQGTVLLSVTEVIHEIVDDDDVTEKLVEA